MTRILRSCHPLLAFTAALALIVGQAAVFAHFAGGTHAGLSSDGREFDIAAGAPRAAAPAAVPPGDGFSTQRPAASTSTHPCSFETLLRERLERPAVCLVVERVAELPRPYSAPARPAWVPGLPRILLAPKNSPPSA